MSRRVRTFFAYYKPYRRLLLADVICAVVVSVTALLLPLCARYITKNVLEPQVANALEQILAMGGVMVGLLVVQTLCNTFVDYQGHMMGTRMESDMRADLFDHYQKLSFAFYDDHKTGQLMSRLTHDLLAVSELYHHGPEESIIAVLKFFGAFIILLMINVWLTLVIFLFLPVMIAYAIYFNRRMNAALRCSRERIGDVNAQVEDTLSGIRVVKSFTNEAVERVKFAAENQRFVDSRRDGYRSESYFYAGMTAFIQGITIIVIVAGGIAILNASLELADLVTYLLFVAILVDPIQKFMNLARLYQEGITGFDRFMEVMAIEPDIQDAPGARAIERVQGNLEFDAVSFRYREDHEFILRNVSLTIRAGEYVALVGTSGVGKTTLCSLIPRFYEISEGIIRLDGHDIRTITQRSLRQQIGIVQQDVYLFSGTVAENICYGRPNAKMEDIIAAAKQANAHDFIMSLSEGYDTDIGQRGVKLSGGQKQRISIARVFLKDPPIIIFDEATSALDNESERAVQDSLERLRHDRTTLVIAHRLSTVRRAERIIVLTDSGIEEQGTHDELIDRGGRYAQLYNLQLDL